MDSGTEVYGTLVSDIQTDVEVTGKPVYMSATGNPITVNVRKGNMKNGVITFEPMQSGSGTPSQDNVRPIVPYSSLEVAVNGSITVIDINGIQYGGELDLTTGILKIYYEIIKVTSSSQIRRNSSNNYYVYTPVNYFESTSINVYSNKFRSYQAGRGVCFLNQNGNIRFNTINDYDTIEAMLDDIGYIEFCAKLNSPLILQVHPMPIILDRGSNTITVNGNSAISFDYYSTLAGKISGTLHYIENGLSPSGYLSGSGNFIALHLESDDWSIYTSVKVGLDPSQASGMVEILQDEEKIVVGKITDNEQVFIVESTDGEFTKTDVYSLTDLVLETE